jgi:hypothetical protein
MRATIGDYFPDDDTIHCAVCEKDDVTGVKITFECGFMTDTKMCMPCLAEVLRFKDRMTDPQYKRAKNTPCVGSSEVATRCESASPEPPAG